MTLNLVPFMFCDIYDRAAVKYFVRGIHYKVDTVTLRRHCKTFKATLLSLWVRYAKPKSMLFSILYSLIEL